MMKLLSDSTVMDKLLSPNFQIHLPVPLSATESQGCSCSSTDD